MAKFTAFDYLSTTAVQLAAFPQGLWSLAKNGALPRLPSKDDGLTAAAHTVVGSVIGAGISAFAQNLAAKGNVAALTGSRLGWTELNWSSLGSAVVIGAAIGASIGIATYLAREGNRARVLSEERNSPTSQTNVSLLKMEKEGPDPWAINRILEKDPKSMRRLEDAVLVHTMDLTHTGPSKAMVHASIALATALVARRGKFESNVYEIKQDWLRQRSEQLAGSPSAQLLLNTLTEMPPAKSEISVLDMHSSWATMLSEQMAEPDSKAFEAAFSAWAGNYFQSPSLGRGLAPACYALVVDLAKDPDSAVRVRQEAAQMDAMVASMLLDTPIAVKQVEPMSMSPVAAWKPMGPSLG